MKLGEMLSILLTLATILGILGILVTLVNINYKIYERDIDPLEITIQDLQPEGEVKEFLIVGKRFSEFHDYSDNYTCVNYTNDLFNIAEELGFKTKKVEGCPEEANTTCHAWLKLEVDYEPQTASIVDYSKKYPRIIK